MPRELRREARGPRGGLLRPHERPRQPHTRPPRAPLPFESRSVSSRATTVSVSLTGLLGFSRLPPILAAAVSEADRRGLLPRLPAKTLPLSPGSGSSANSACLPGTAPSVPAWGQNHVCTGLSSLTGILTGVGHPVTLPSRCICPDDATRRHPSWLCALRRPHKRAALPNLCLTERLQTEGPQGRPDHSPPS